MPKPKATRRARVTARREASRTAPGQRSKWALPFVSGKGNGNGKHEESGPVNENWFGRHPLLSAFLSVVFVMLVFGTCNTSEDAPADTSAIATAVADLHGILDEEVSALRGDVDTLTRQMAREPTPGPTATVEPTATPCGPFTYPGCAPAPTPDIGRQGIIAPLCQEVTALSRAISQAFDPDGEPPSRTLMGKLGRLNDSICTLPVDATPSEVCVAAQVAVNDALATIEDEPNVMSLAQLETLREIVDVSCK